MTKTLISSVAAGALLVGVAFAPMSFAQQTTTPPAEPETMEPEAMPATPAPDEQAQTPEPATPTPAEPETAETPAPVEPDSEMAATEGDEYLTQQSDDQIVASNYMGQPVYNTADESIGDINDLLIKKDGGVEAAVIGVGGFLGIGEKLVAVPFDRIEISEQPDSGELKLTTTETADSLKAAPEFKTKAQLMAERDADPQLDPATTSGVEPAPMEPAPEPAPQQ